MRSRSGAETIPGELKRLLRTGAKTRAAIGEPAGEEKQSLGHRAGTGQAITAWVEVGWKVVVWVAVRCAPILAASFTPAHSLWRYPTRPHLIQARDYIIHDKAQTAPYAVPDPAAPRPSPSSESDSIPPSSLRGSSSKPRALRSGRGTSASADLQQDPVLTSTAVFRFLHQGP